MKVKSLTRVWLFVTSWAVASTRLLHPWDFLGKSTGVGCHFLLQGIFPTQGSNPGLLHCRQTLYHLSHRASYHGSQTQNGLALPTPAACYFFLPLGLSTLATTAFFLSLVRSMPPVATRYSHILSSLIPPTLFLGLLAHLNSFQPFKYQCKKFPYFIDLPDWARFSHSQALEYHKSPLSTYSKGSFPFI